MVRIHAKSLGNYSSIHDIFLWRKQRIFTLIVGLLHVGVYARAAGDASASVPNHPVHIIYLSKQPIVQVSTAQTAMQLIVNEATSTNAGGVTVSASLGTSSSQSNTASNANTARGSNVQGAGNVSITATGGDLTVQGSTIAADHTTSLNASGSINLLASQNTTSQTNSSSSSSTSAGVSFGIGQGTAGPSFNIAASRGNGNGQGTEVTNTNTQVSGTRVNINSGGNTTLQGAVVAANTVNADIKGNLAITSLQDTSTFNETSRSQGGSMSFSAAGIPTGGSISSGRTAINSNFASVNEQSGIRAGGTAGPSGSGGFNINVGGTTTLAGGQITSSQAAVDAARNTFNSTGGTTITDIQNTAAYNASGSEMTIGVGGNQSSAGIGRASGNASSTSTSGISGIAGDANARTGDAGAGITPIFNRNTVAANVQAQVQITQQFTPQATQAWGSYATRQLEAAIDNKDPEAIACWGPTGGCRAAGHVFIGGITGGGGAAAGAGLSSVSAPVLQSTLIDLGLSPQAANNLTVIFATGLGSVVGGSAGAAGALNESANNWVNFATRISELGARAGASGISSLTANGQRLLSWCATNATCSVMLPATAIAALQASNTAAPTGSSFERIPTEAPGGTVLPGTLLPPLGPMINPVPAPAQAVSNNTGGTQLDPSAQPTGTPGTPIAAPVAGSNTTVSPAATPQGPGIMISQNNNPFAQNAAGAPDNTRIVAGATITDIRTGASQTGNVNLGPTLDRIASGTGDSHRNDGTQFNNIPKEPTDMTLPSQIPGYYTEHVIRTPGINTVGPQRIVTGRNGEIYYTSDHYHTFIPLNPRTPAPLSPKKP
jgi:filamentous hemagglutinin